MKAKRDNGARTTSSSAAARHAVALSRIAARRNPQGTHIGTSASCRRNFYAGRNTFTGGSHLALLRTGTPARRVLSCSMLLGSSCALFAHVESQSSTTARSPGNWHELLQSWAFDPWVVVPLVLSLWLYLVGLRKLWEAMRVGAGIRKWEAACYLGGWFALVIALVSPLHPWGQVLFSAHMTQHEILMLVAAPLLVLGRPILAFAKALPNGWARVLARTVMGARTSSSAAAADVQSTGSTSDAARRMRVAAGGDARAPGLGHVWRFATNPFVAWLIHALVLWMWHIPSWFQSTLHNEFIHALQHVSFLGSALLFWWAVMHGRRRLAGYGLAVLFMFTTALHSGMLGALLTFARQLWYPAYAETAPLWGLTGLQDQQLGGLIMWIPAGLVYIVAGLAFAAGWLRESDRRAAADLANRAAAVPG